MNYQSDFKILEGLKDGTSILSAPFRFTYYVKMDKGVYVAEYNGSEFTNCRPTDDGRVVVPFDHPRLGLGELMVKREFYLTDSDFKDGICNLVSVESTGITLDKGATDDGDVVVELFPYYQKGDKGDKMTYDDLTEEEKVDLAKKVIGDAEDKRRAAEIIRQQNEAKREQGEKNRTDAFEEAQDERRYAFNAELGEFSDEFRQEEQGRQNVFSENEIQRNVGEEKRVAAETNREEAEALRASNEAKRQEAEVVREANEKRREETYKSKVDRDDNAPKLTAGFANNLVGRGEATEEEISFRPSGGDTSIEDGTARIDKLKGNTVVWNQYREDNNTEYSLDGIKTSYDSATHLICIENISRTTNYGSGSNQIVVTKNNINYGHKFISITSIGNDEGIMIVQSGSGLDKTYGVNEIFTAEHINDVNIQIRVTYKYDFVNKHPIGNKFYFYLNIYDLTQMFGAGNEPTTIEEFNARKPIGIDEYAYNEGELISTNVDEVKSVGFNAWDEEWEKGAFNILTGDNTVSETQIRAKNKIPIIGGAAYFCKVNASGVWTMFYDKNENIIERLNINASQSGNCYQINNRIITMPNNVAYMRFYVTNDYGATYNNDICIHLVHTGYRNGEYEPYKEFRRSIPISEIKDSDGNQLFPLGLLSAGSVCDEITATKAIKRIGVVDMGTLDWGYSTTTAADVMRYYSRGMKARKINVTDVCNALCHRYSAGSENQTYQNSNKSVVSVSGSIVYVRDPNYSSVAQLESFKAAMSGVMLYYELAEPIEVDLEEPINMDYEVSDFGTEEVLSSEPTTPLKADIIYQFNAVDRIRDNSRHTAEAEVKLKEYETRIKSLEDIVAALTQQTPSGEEVINQG